MIWVDKTNTLVTYRCLVSISLAIYKDLVWYDILPMDVSHILFDKSQLYDMYVIHYSKVNRYYFEYNGAKIKLVLSPPKEIRTNTFKRIISSFILVSKSLHILKFDPFSTKLKDSKIVFVFKQTPLESKTKSAP